MSDEDTEKTTVEQDTTDASTSPENINNSPSVATKKRWPKPTIALFTLVVLLGFYVAFMENVSWRAKLCKATDICIGITKNFLHSDGQGFPTPE